MRIMEINDLKGMFALIELAKTRGFEITQASGDDDYVEVNGIRLDYLEHTAEDIKEMYSQKCKLIYKIRDRLVVNGYTCIGSPKTGFTVDGAAITSTMMLDYSYERLIDIANKAKLVTLHKLLDNLFLLENSFESVNYSITVASLISGTKALILHEKRLSANA